MKLFFEAMYSLNIPPNGNWSFYTFFCRSFSFYNCTFLYSRDALKAQQTMNGRYYAGRMLNVEFCKVFWWSAICGRSHIQPDIFNIKSILHPAYAIGDMPDRFVAQLFVSFQI